MKEQEHTLPSAVNADFVATLEAETRHLEPKPVEDDRPKAGPFPVDAFPKPIAELLEVLRSQARFPVDYSAAGLLFTASTAIGNSTALNCGPYTASAALWLLAVGAPSVGKSPPVDLLTRPLTNHDRRTKAEHDHKVREWETAQEERKGKKRDKNAPTQEPPAPRPVWRPHVVGDITMEALLAKLSATPRGLGRHNDEFLGFLQSMDAYRSGGDRPKWLSIFNGSPITEIRKTAGEHLVPRPFVALAGGIQTGKLAALAGADDGFLHRLLVLWPDVQHAEYATTTELPATWISWWGQVVDYLLGLEMDLNGGDPQPVVLRYAEQAAAMYAAWDRRHTDRKNAAIEAGDELTAALLGKLDTYHHRLALVLELLHRACDDQQAGGEVRTEAVEGSQKLLGYFERTARKMHFNMFQASPLDRLAGDKLGLYDALPGEFTTAEAIVKADGMGLSARTMKRRLNEWSKGRQPLLAKDGQGRYRKQFEH